MWHSASATRKTEFPPLPGSQSVGAAVTKVPPTGRLRQRSSLTVPEAAQSRIPTPADSVSSEVLLPLGSRSELTAQKGLRERRGVSFIRTLIPLNRAPPTGPNHLSKAPPLALGFQYRNPGVGGGGHECTVHNNELIK